METKDLIEWLECEKPFFDAKIKDMLKNIQDRLVAAERMEIPLKYLTDWIDEEGPVAKDFESVSNMTMEGQLAIKQWENLK